MAGTVFLGLDSMDARWTRQWASEGKLPNFAQLFATWPSLPTRNPEGMLVGGLWPSFWSQSGVAEHGSYCWRQLIPGTYITAEKKPTDFDASPFWLRLDDAGVRCAIFDMPLVRPIPLRHGVHIVDWGTHDSQLDPTFTDSSMEERFAAWGPYPQKRCDLTVEQHGRERLIHDLHRGIEMRTAAVSSLLADDFDFVAAVFSETHCTGHQLFHLSDTTSDLHDAAMRERIGEDPILSLYQDTDRALGVLLKEIPADAAVMVLFSHSFGPHFDGNRMLREILERLAAVHRPPTRLARLRERARRLMQGGVRRVRRALVPHGNHLRWPGNVDSAQPWFSVPNNDLYGAVRLNLRGREPWGRVTRGSDEEAMIALLTEELLALRHEGSGAPAVVRVIRTDDHHHGRMRDHLPDLVVEWNWTERFAALTSPSIGVVRDNYLALRTGDHRPYGEVLVRGLELPKATEIRVDQLAGVLVTDLLARRATANG